MEKRTNIKDQKKYQFGREMAEMTLERIIQYGLNLDGNGSIYTIPCEAVGELIHKKAIVLPNNLKAIDFLVKNAKTDINKGVADQTKERLEQYIRENNIPITFKIYKKYYGK